MLRTSIASVSRRASRAPAAAAGGQWQAAVGASARPIGQRTYADDRKHTPAVPKLPASETNTAASSRIPATAADPVAKATIPTENIPLTPPAPEAAITPKVTSTASSTPPSPPPPAPAPKPRKGFFTRLRNYVFTLLLLGAISFGGGVWYSRISDNFHDFFTEYVPFGEQAVLYMEDMEFRKRAPSIAKGGTNHARDGEVIKMPAQSGASWRVADRGEPAGRQSSAVDKASAAAKSGKGAAAPAPEKADTTPKESAKAVGAPTKGATAELLPKAAAKTDATKPPTEPSSKDMPSSTPRATLSSKPDASKAAVPASGKSTGFKVPEVDEPSRLPPSADIDLATLKGSSEPIVQDLTQMLNDIIAAINLDGASDRYSSTIFKAKSQLEGVNDKINAVRERVEKEAASKLKTRMNDFDKAATDLLNRVESAMAAQEAGWQEDFKEEMAKVQEAYDTRLKTLKEREKQIYEEKSSNKLMQQAIELKRLFGKEVAKSVENEREGRLAKLDNLSSAVTDLEKLTAGWNDVVDTNLRTQQLHVAVDAVRNALQDTAQPRPFIKELVALKEIAEDDTVVSAAIASINPTAYQRGISSGAELMDRFRRVASEVRKASLLPDNAGVASHASSWVLSHIMFKKDGIVGGDDVESVLTRTQTLLQEGDLDGAAREMNGLTGWARTLSKDWMAEVRKVLEVQQALEVIQTEARLQSLKVE